MRLSLAAVVLSLFAAAPAIACDDGFTFYNEIPAGHTLYAKADSLAALQKATQPTLAVTLPGPVCDQTYFIWTGTTPDGARHFSLASIYTLESAKGQDSKIIFNPLKPGAETAYSVYPRVTTTVTKADLNASPLAKAGQTQSLSACVASMHPKLGTLYQLSLDRTYNDWAQHDEKRFYVMHDPDHGWRFVGEVGGTLRLDTKPPFASHHKRNVTVTSINWTGVGDAPVKLNCAVAAEYQSEADSPRTPLTQIAGTFTLGGTLPARQTESSFSVVIKKDDTYSGLLARLQSFRNAAPEPGDFDSLDLKKMVRSLNPTLDPARLKIGDELRIPDLYGPNPRPQILAAR